ncbi:MAG: DNA polymerase III subunit alpha, partial [Chloroflexi bacterium]|nr:DNA polymerase III subunit alpha [Chloroflexota bacterium]
MTSTYVELHAHSFFSFGEGASHAHELLSRAAELGYPALALTDTNMCGAMEFARTAKQFGVRPITGGEITLADGSHLTLLAKDRTGYANICRLFTYANETDRQAPRLDPKHLPDHAQGIVLLTGCRKGLVPTLVSEGRFEKARGVLMAYMEWFGRDSVYVELSQTFTHGDTRRNRELVRLAGEVGASVVATNNVHYHVPERYRLQNALVAIKHNATLNEVIHELKLSGQFYLKSDAEMKRLFRWCPEAIENTSKIAAVCAFDLTTDLGYKLPTPAVPEGHTPTTYLRRLADEAAQRRYGGITNEVEARLDEELRLIEKHGLAGFLLIYRDIVRMGHEIMLDEGLVSPETPLEEQPPGRGRGSSVALLIGYLLGISHVDPLLYGLTLERFLPDDMETLPDIDLDFPRSIRDKLIEKIHKEWGKEFAVLVGAISTYRIKGIISDLGKAFGLPQESLRRLKKQLHSSDVGSMRAEMLELAEFRDKVDAPGWRDLLELGPQLMRAPKRLSQHVGGMVLSTTPIPEMIPVRDGAIEGRYIMDWDKDSVADANFAKIDILSLPVLDQMNDARDLVKERTGEVIDISRIDPEDQEVYDMIGEGKALCVFDLQSPAQLKMGQRLLPKNYTDLAYQVALIRPGVGVQGSAVSKFLERYRHGAPWSYDHPLEERALERGYGIIVWQEQVTQLIMDVAGLSGAEAEEIRRDFARPNNDHLIAR